MRFVISIAILLAALAARGEDIRFRHLTMADGLSDNSVNHIMCDSHGFMWFATSHGLSRYDGYSFRNFYRGTDASGSLTVSHVESVQEDASGTLWIKHWGENFECYDTRKEIFTDAAEVASAYGVTDKISYVLADSEKNLWIHCCKAGTYHYDFGRGKLTSYPSGKHTERAGAVLTSMAEDGDGVLRMYSDGFFDHIGRAPGTVDFENDYLVAPEGKGMVEYRVLADMDGDYWIFGKGGVGFYDTRTKVWSRFSTRADSRYRLTSDDVWAAVCDRYGRVWLGTDNGGINIIDKKAGTIRYIGHSESDGHSLIQRSVHCLYADSAGGIWAGTFKSGVSYYNENMFRLGTDGFSEFAGDGQFIPDVSALAQGPDGKLYIGVPDAVIVADGGLKSRSIVRLPSVPHTLPYNEVLALSPALDGTLWIGTYNTGLMSYRDGEFRHYSLDSSDTASIANKMVWSITEAPSGYLWIGTWGAGLWGMDPSTGRVNRSSDINGTFDGEHISSILVSRDGNVYMGTPYGMLVYSPSAGTFEKLCGDRRHSREFSNLNISHIAEDSRGLLWLSTRQGVDIYDRRTDSITTLPGQIANAIVQSVAEDAYGNMWVATNDCMYHVVVGNSKNGYSFSLHKYGSRSIAGGQQFNPRAILLTRNGDVVAGGVRGVSTVSPAGIEYDSPLPKVRFTDLSLFSRSVKVDSAYQGNTILKEAIGFTDHISLDCGQNMFAVSFSTMDYVNSGKTMYAYMLEGLDSGWTITSENRLSYANIGPGKYTLKVKAVDDDGKPGAETAELKIAIAPPFYLSSAAYIVYVCLLLGGIWLVRAWMRHNQAQKIKMMQIRQEAMQKHELDNMKLRFFTNISHDLRTPLTLILTPLEYVADRVEDEELKGKLQMARNNAVRLLDMVNKLLDFRKSDMTGHTLVATRGDIVSAVRAVCRNFEEYSEHRGISLSFYAPFEKLYIKFDGDKMDKILMNLLSNAFKFTPKGGRVDVSLDLVEPEGAQEVLEIRVADNGCGISDEHKPHVFDRFYQVPHDGGDNTVCGSGVGLNLVKEFAGLHGGAVEVVDNIGKGSVFVVRIPVVDAETQPETPEMAGIEISEPTGEGAGDSRPSILIVDDNDDFRVFMKDCLKADYTVYEAPDGAKAWDMLQELQPDIIVSDVMMPGMDGHELCRMVKNDIRTSHILVILLTARAAKEHEQKGLETGADDYITKPFNLNILNLRIKNLLQRRRDAQSNSMEISPKKIDVTPLDKKLITKAIQYVDENLGRSDLSVDELSRELGMSRVHLYKKLRSIAGKTPIEFIRVLRLKRAAQLLRESQQSIAEITYQTGFNNLTLFRKYFKAEFGMLPSEYQARYAENEGAAPAE